MFGEIPRKRKRRKHVQTGRFHIRHFAPIVEKWKGLYESGPLAASNLSDIGIPKSNHPNASTWDMGGHRNRKELETESRVF